MEWWQWWTIAWCVSTLATITALVVACELVGRSEERRRAEWNRKWHR